MDTRLTRLIVIAFPFLLAVSCNHQRQSLDLSGVWDCELGRCTLPGTTDLSALGNKADTSTVNTKELTREHSWKGPVTFAKGVIIPEEFEGKRLRLVMERTKPSTLFIDGVRVGECGMLTASHIYNLPKLEKGTHQFEIRIDNSDSSVPSEVLGSHAWSESTQTNWNGILGRFAIEATDSSYISEVMLRTDERKAFVDLTVESEKAGKASIRLNASLDGKSQCRKTVRTKLEKGLNHISCEMDFGEKARPWSEFHPDLYTLDITLKAGDNCDSYSEVFGLREFKADGKQFTINGFKTFLRGKHDGCVFPLSGYAPTDRESWVRYFEKARSFGINHVRFHSYTPTEAAFQAADELGMYLQVELPFWGVVSRKKEKSCEFYIREGESILRQFGNHPSFVMMGLGNELHGDVSLMREWIEDFRKLRPDIQYCFGSNNFLGNKGPQEGEDYYVTVKVKPGTRFETNVRSAFSFADEPEGGILNGTRPNTAYDYSQAIENVDIPVVGHEIAQFQTYPDYKEIEKYSSILKPRNMEAFRAKMMETYGMDRSAEFQEVSGNWALECYKAEMEAALRTDGFGGFQLLDLQDYSGQGTALVGVLDAFMDEKGIDNLNERWLESCSPLVLLARFNDWCLWSDDTLKVDLQIANFLENDWEEKLECRIYVQTGHEEALLEEEFFQDNASQGTLSNVGRLEMPLKDIVSQDFPSTIIIKLNSGDKHNTYKLFCYPHPRENENFNNIYYSECPKMEKELAEGKTVILVRPGEIGGLFTPDFWNWSMFKGISEANGKEVSPGTLSILVNDSHFMELFPTGESSGWQWWSILKNARPDILRKGDKALVEVIDNIQRGLPLTILYEKDVEAGRLVVCTVNPDAISDSPEGEAFKTALENL